MEIKSKMKLDNWKKKHPGKSGYSIISTEKID